MVIGMRTSNIPGAYPHFLCMRRSPLAEGIYSPLLQSDPNKLCVFAHLAQSLDGRIALENGESKWLSGPEDLDHTHQLRAISDAILVGAATIQYDNPRLTVRRVPGESPMRVVVDPRLRLRGDYHVFAPGGPPTVVICGENAEGSAPVDTIRIPTVDGRLRPADICEVLYARGVRRLMIEGGALTVSHFLNAGCLERLHIVIAPVILGQGRSSLLLETLPSLGHALRPKVAVHMLGEDILLDCDLSENQ